MTIHIEVTDSVSETALTGGERIITEKPFKCDPVTALYAVSGGTETTVGRNTAVTPSSDDTVIACRLDAVSRPYRVSLKKRTFNLKSRIVGLYDRYDLIGIPFANAVFRGASSFTFKMEMNDCEWYEGAENRTVRCVAHVGIHRVGDTYYIRNYGYRTLTADIIKTNAVGMTITTVEEGTYYPVIEWVEFLDPVYHHPVSESSYGMEVHQRVAPNRVYDLCKWVDGYCEKTDYEHTNIVYGYQEVLANYLNAGGTE